MLELESPDVWSDQERAQKLGQQRASLQDTLDVFDTLDSGLGDANDLLDMAREEDDEDTLNAVIADLASYEERVAGLKFRRMFAGDNDAANAFLDIQSGSGGTEAQDWAEMLLRMFLRWGEREGFKTELIEVATTKPEAALMFEDFATMIGNPALLEASAAASEQTQKWLDAIWNSAIRNESA